MYTLKLCLVFVVVCNFRYTQDYDSHVHIAACDLQREVSEKGMHCWLLLVACSMVHKAIRGNAAQWFSNIVSHCCSHQNTFLGFAELIICPAYQGSHSQVSSPSFGIKCRREEEEEGPGSQSRVYVYNGVFGTCSP